jgi:hypothetical protein
MKKLLKTVLWSLLAFAFLSGNVAQVVASGGVIGSVGGDKK